MLVYDPGYMTIIAKAWRKALNHFGATDESLKSFATRNEIRLMYIRGRWHIRWRQYHRLHNEPCCAAC